MKLLHLDSSILGSHSASRALSVAAVEHLKNLNPDLYVTYRDLAANPVPQLSGAYLSALSRTSTSHADELQRDIALGSAILEEFLATDILVIGVAFYNFTISSQLKTWIDRILVAGKTFRYSETGVESLVGTKRLILTIARGGIYGAGSPTESFEHAESYLRSVFGFLGIKHPDVVIAEGLAMGPERREAALKVALDKISSLQI